MGGADGDLREHDAGADETLRRSRDDVAVVDVDVGAERLQRLDEEIDRARADGAAAGQRHPRLTHARQQRADDPEARAHPRDEIVGRGGIDDFAGAELQRFAVHAVLARALAEHHAIDAVVSEDALQHGDVGESRDVVEGEGLVGEEGRDHERQGGVLGAGNLDRAVQPIAAGDADSIHARRPCPFSEKAAGIPRKNTPGAADRRRSNAGLRPPQGAAWTTVRRSHCGCCQVGRSLAYTNAAPVHRGQSLDSIRE